jgi:hypothetical protein
MPTKQDAITGQAVAAGIVTYIEIPKGAVQPRRDLIFACSGIKYKILGKRSNGLWYATDLTREVIYPFVLLPREWMQAQVAGNVTILDPGDMADTSWQTPPFNAEDSVELYQRGTAG